MKMQKGFTLIELIVVIVILGILAATALPKFVSLSNDARYASAQGALASVNSAAAMVHAYSLIHGTAGLTSSSAVIEGTTPVTIAFGYPDATATGIVLAAGISPTNYQISGTASPLLISPIGVTTPSTSGCSVVYTVATSTTVPASAVLGVTNSSSCQ